MAVAYWIYGTSQSGNYWYFRGIYCLRIEGISLGLEGFTLKTETSGFNETFQSFPIMLRCPDPEVVHRIL